MGRRITPDFLASIAEQYTAHVDAGVHPAPAISETEGVPVATVRRWVWTARKQGLLPPGRPCLNIPPVRLPEARPPSRSWWVEQETGGEWATVDGPHESSKAALVALGIFRARQRAAAPLRIVRNSTTSVVEHTEL